MAIDLTPILNKIENKGETAQGKLTATEFNTLVAAVRENQASVRSVSYNSGVKIKPDENGNVDLIITESNYILRLKTTVDGVAPYKVALGNDYNMTVEISNKYLDGDEQVSVSTACTATFYCNDLVVNTQEVYDGDTINFNFGKYFIEGKNTIYVNVNNNYGEIQNTMTYEITAIYLSVELPNFNPTELKEGDSWDLDVKVVGSSANVYIYVDDVGGLAGSQTAGSTITYSIKYGLFTGAHKLKVYAVSSEDSRVQTDPIISEYIYTVEGSTQTVVATTLQNNTVMTLYNVLTIDYWVYKPEFSGELPITVSIINDEDRSINHSTQNITFTNGLTPVLKWDTSLFEDSLIGDRRVRFEVDGVIRDIPIQINAADIKLNDIGGYDFVLSSAGRSNNDVDVRDWSYGEYKVTFPEDLEFSDTASGWNRDKDDNITLHLRRGREISLNYYPFRDNPAYGNDEDIPGTKKGMTFSIELATRNCVKRDASIVRCIYGGVGFEFFANSMRFASNSESLEADYKEDTRVRIDLVIEGQPITYTYDDGGVTKRDDEARMLVYVDGVYQQMLLTSSVTNFAQAIPQPITIGSEYCDVDIYCIRAYRTALDMKGITDNYAYDTPKVEDKIAIARRCDVFDSTLNVSYPKLVKARPELPVMLIGMETLPNSKTKIPVATTVYDNPLNEDDYEAGNPSWTSANDEMGNQGTSSMNYPMPYRNFDWKTVSKSFLVGTQTYKKIPLYAGMPPIGKLTFKKDYASSEMANNVICTDMYNTMAVGLKDTFPNCLNDAQNTLDYYNYRLGLKGIPFFIFQYWNNTYKPLGMFNFIPNKNEHEYLGFTAPFTWENSRAQSWEIRDNNIFWDFYLDESAWDSETNSLIKNCPFRYYEAIYPKDSSNKSGGESLDFGDASTAAQVEVSKNETKDILRLHNWLVSTNQSLATGALLDTPYVDASGNKYSYDSAAYRLAKFVTEHNYYLVLDQWILYYIWREQFWMFDSGSKNLQLHTYDGQHWGCHVRDCDTALGIDNEGKFVFPPYLEDTDYRKGNEFIFNQKTKPEDSETVLNGQLGAIWINIRDAFGDRIQQMYTTLYENAANTKFNYDKCIAEFENHQSKWSEALYNFGSKQYYGGAPYSKWISSGLGDKKNQRRYWLYYGFRYRASKYHAGSASNRITWRQFGTGCDLNIKTYSEMYVSLGFGAYDYKTTKRYRCLDLENGVTVKNELTTNVNDVVMYLFNGDMITDIGNLYEFGNIGSLDLTNAKRLRTLKVGNKDRRNSTQYVNTKLTSLVLTNCDALEYLDLTGCEGFGTGTGQNGIYTLDLSKQTLLQEFYCSGATMSGITFPETSSLTKVHIGDNLSRIRLVNLPSLQSFTMDGGAKVQSFIMRNCGIVSRVNSYDSLVNILANENNVLSDIEVEGIDWADASAEIIELLCDKKAKLKGKINIVGANQISFALKRKLMKEYGNIDDSANALHITYEVRNIKSIYLAPKYYYTSVGEYTLKYELDSPYANNYVREEWSMASNLYATINKEDGTVTVTRIGDEVDGSGPNANVTVTIYLLDGTTVSATTNVNFWEREVRVGDIIYHDGSVSMPDDSESEMANGKTPIGVCFYIDPENKERRLMVALEDLPDSWTWGLSNYTTPGFVLADNPDINIFDIKAIPNVNNPIGVNLSKLRDEVYGDKDGWALLDGTVQAEGSIGWRVFTEDEFGYTTGESIPWGKYFYLHIINVRDKVLTDSNFNLPLPNAIGEQSEMSRLKTLYASANASYGQYYGDCYFPATSACRAYCPTKKEGTLDKFKEHNWWLPSYGEMLRLVYYLRQYIEGNENPILNPLKKAIDSGVMKSVKTSSSYLTSSEPYNNASRYYYRFTVNSSQNAFTGIATTGKNNNNIVRPICQF